jgi:hypothetical protein
MLTSQFVYPFTLEQHVLSLQPSPHDAISQRRARNAEILHRREVEEEQKESALAEIVMIWKLTSRKQALHKLAPGYNPSSLLMPTSTKSPPPQAPQATQKVSRDTGGIMDLIDDGVSGSGPNTVDEMDDLITKLGGMESKR